MFVKKLYVHLNHKFIYNYNREYPSVKAQQEFLKKLPVPGDDIEASYNKYLAQLYYYYSGTIRVIFNIGGFLLWPFLLLIYRKKYKKCNFKRNDYDAKGNDSRVIVIKGTKVDPSDIIPPELKQLGKVEYVGLEEKCSLDDDAIEILRPCIKRYLFHPYFLVMIIRRLAETSTLISMYSPSVIAVYARERDFSVSVITKYCENKNVAYDGFMHGDDYFTIDKVDTRYSKYYVWDQHYVEMYSELRCPREQFVVYTPEKLKGITRPRNDDNYDYFMTYYFSAESRKTIQGVLEAFEIFRNKGLKCKIRPHPRFSDMPYLENVFKNYVIEQPNKVNLAESIENSEYVASLNSTVLSQAYYSGKKIAIDDYSDPERYQAMIDRKYIMMQKEHVLISELVKQYLPDKVSKV